MRKPLRYICGAGLMLAPTFFPQVKQFIYVLVTSKSRSGTGKSRIFPFFLADPESQNPRLPICQCQSCQVRSTSASKSRKVTRKRLSLQRENDRLCHVVWDERTAWIKDGHPPALGHRQHANERKIISEIRVYC